MKYRFHFYHLLNRFKLLRIPRNSPKIHVIGDSHSSYCFTNIFPVKTKKEHSLFHSLKTAKQKIPFVIHWMGPMTMHRVGRDGMNAINIKSMGILPQDIVVFVFGEIDVRCHIEKQSVLQNRPWEEIVDELSCRYIQTILENQKQQGSHQCVVCAVVPPTDRAFNKNFPFYGSLETRVAITQTLNRKLHDLCMQNGLILLDLYAGFHTENGDLKMELSDGVHISHRVNTGIKNRLIELIKFVE